jgi:hypothetical protein
MTKGLLATTVAIASALVAVLAIGSPVARAVGSTLSFDTSVLLRIGSGSCGGTTTVGVECVPNSGSAVVPGLGQVTFSFDVIFDKRLNDCTKWTVTAGTLSAPKGTLAFAGASDGCQPSEDGAGGVVDFRFTGGSGPFANASGSGTAAFSPGNLSNLTDHMEWKGTLEVTGYDFDTTPPAFAKTKSRVVRVRHARGAHVRFVVNATDAVDGTVSATCTPPSGSFFALGKTRVNCQAADSSGNTATTSFLVIVQRRR